MEKQFCASVYIIHRDQVLLLWHKKLQKWLPAGGHLEPNELPSEAAIREAFEETGYEIELLSFDPLTIKEPNARSFPRPFHCLLEEIPPYKDTPAHQHIDFVYVGRPIGGTETPLFEEIEGIYWFSPDEIENLRSDIDIYEESRKMIRAIFQTMRQNPHIFSEDRELECTPL